MENYESSVNSQVFTSKRGDLSAQISKSGVHLAPLSTFIYLFKISFSSFEVLSFPLSQVQFSPSMKNAALYFLIASINLSHLSNAFHVSCSLALSAHCPVSPRTDWRIR